MQDKNGTRILFAAPADIISRISLIILLTVLYLCHFWLYHFYVYLWPIMPQMLGLGSAMGLCEAVPLRSYTGRVWSLPPPPSCTER